MNLVTLLMIAVGLSMDAFAVSVTDGMVNRKLNFGKTLYIALTFGIFQGIMPTIGYLAGTAFSSAISSLDHWVALILLCFIGGKMIWDAVGEIRRRDQKRGGEIPELFSYRLIMVQGVATSIDALAMGVSFAVMNVNIAAAAAFIAGITFVCSFTGVRIGKKCGGMLKDKAQLFGGCVLVLIGFKIFIEHMWG